MLGICGYGNVHLNPDKDLAFEGIFSLSERLFSYLLNSKDKRKQFAGILTTTTHLKSIELNLFLLLKYILEILE